MSEYDVEKFMAQFKKEPLVGIAGPTSGDFSYVARLLQHPLTDGRHRALWLIIAPYAVSILRLPRDAAVDFVRTYFEQCDAAKPCSDVLNMVEHFVDNALGLDPPLKPPHLDTLKNSDPDLYEIIRVTIAE